MALFTRRPYLTRSNDRRPLAAIALLATCAAALAEPMEHCDTLGRWTKPGETAQAVGVSDLIQRLSTRQVVLLGEHHDDVQHHHWQLHTLAALHSRQPQLVIGFEGFPRAVQPVLDRWIAGKLTPAQFLREVNWERNWGYDPNHYLPIFEFARLHRVKLIALNVDRSLARRVGQSGWDAVPPQEREGVGDPAPASADYRATLRAAYLAHPNAHREGSEDDPDNAAFSRFVDGMLLWDRAMAEAIAIALPTGETKMVVGIVGRGHVEYGHGIPHQLAALGVTRVAVLLPWNSAQPCTLPPIGIADAVYGLPKPLQEPNRPRLGVELAAITEASVTQVRVQRVMSQSIAEQTGLRAGDIIQNIAGTPVASAETVIAAVKRQAPGTWLPLTILRDGQIMELIAKFPPAP